MDAPEAEARSLVGGVCGGSFMCKRPYARTRACGKCGFRFARALTGAKVQVKFFLGEPLFHGKQRTAYRLQPYC